MRAGTSAISTGDHARALLAFEKAHACRPEVHDISLAFVAACNSQNVSRARYWWRKMSADTQSHDLVICIRNHITPHQLDGDGVH